MHLAAGVLIISYTTPIYAWILKYLTTTAAGGFVGMSPEQIVNYFEIFIADRFQVAIFAIINIAIMSNI